MPGESGDGALFMETQMRRALIGYRRGPTLALIAAVTREGEEASVARAAALEDVGRRYEPAAVQVKEAEARIAQEQERQAQLHARLGHLAARADEVVEQARQRFARSEAEVVAAIARKEALRGQRRRLLRTLRDDVSAAVERTLQQIGPPPTTSALAEGWSDGPPLRERADV